MKKDPRNPLLQNGQELIPSVAHVVTAGQPLYLFYEVYRDQAAFGALSLSAIPEPDEVQRWQQQKAALCAALQARQTQLEQLKTQRKATPRPSGRSMKPQMPRKSPVAVSYTHQVP